MGCVCGAGWRDGAVADGCCCCGGRKEGREGWAVLLVGEMIGEVEVESYVGG